MIQKRYNVVTFQIFVELSRSHVICYCSYKFMYIFNYLSNICCFCRCWNWNTNNTPQATHMQYYTYIAKLFVTIIMSYYDMYFIIVNTDHDQINSA